MFTEVHLASTIDTEVEKKRRKQKGDKGKRK
jgi:hypothetical protein